MAQRIKRFLQLFRDVYVGLLFIPLWIWTILYQTTVERNAGWTWVTNLAPIVSPLIFALGALALWQYLEKLFMHPRSSQHALSGFQSGNVWGLSITVFLMGVGSLLQSTGVFWGAFLVGISELLIPLLVLWLLLSERKESSVQIKQKSEGTSDPESGI